MRSWNRDRRAKLFCRDWARHTDTPDWPVLLLALPRWRLSPRRSMKWSLVSRTRWCARTQLSHRYSWQSRQWEVAGFSSSQELHCGSPRWCGWSRPPGAWLKLEETPPKPPLRWWPFLCWICSSELTTTSSKLLKRKFEEGKESTPASVMDTFWSQVGHRSFSGSPGLRWPSRQCLQKAWRQGRTWSLLVVWLEEDEVCEEDEDVEELDEIGAEEPHSSLQSGHVCRSESGNEAICSGTEAQISLQHAQQTAWGILLVTHRPLCHVENNVECEVDSLSIKVSSTVKSSPNRSSSVLYNSDVIQNKEVDSSSKFWGQKAKILRSCSCVRRVFLTGHSLLFLIQTIRWQWSLAEAHKIKPKLEWHWLGVEVLWAPSFLSHRLGNMTTELRATDTAPRGAQTDFRFVFFFYSVFPLWALVVVVVFLSSPPSEPVQATSGAGNGRSVVAARASDRNTVNYSSKQRSHRVPCVLGKPTEPPVQPKHQTGRLRQARVHRSTLWRGRFQLSSPLPFSL